MDLRGGTVQIASLFGALLDVFLFLNSAGVEHDDDEKYLQRRLHELWLHYISPPV